MAFLQSQTQIDALAAGAVLLVLVFIALITGWSARRRIRSLERRLEKFVRGTGPANLEELLTQHADRLGNLGRDIETLKTATAQAEKSANAALKKLSLIRFSAFDSGPELSFSLALLNDDDDGLVLTALYGRDETRVYAKPVQRGGSRYPLAEEEKRAIEVAIRQ